MYRICERFSLFSVVWTKNKNMLHFYAPVQYDRISNEKSSFGENSFSLILILIPVPMTQDVNFLQSFL